MRLVTLKSEAQLDLQVLHRARATGRGADQADQPIARRAARARGDPAQTSHPSAASTARAHGRELPISPRVLRLLQDLRDDWASLDERIMGYDDELAALTREDQQARQLATIPNVGVINATALLAAVGDGSAFARGRDLAAWLGLTPRQHSTAEGPSSWGSASGQQIPEAPADP
jgi:transposase